MFPCKTIPKNLELSYKTDLDFWDGVGRENSQFMAELHKTDYHNYLQ